MRRKRFVFLSESCRLSEIRRSAQEFFLQNGIAEEVSAALILAIDEACTNIIRHAYEFRCRPVRMTIECGGGLLRVILRDYGKNCDPATIRSRPLEEIRPGGVGVHIIRNIFDEVTYTPKPRGTELVMVKRLDPGTLEGQL